MGHNLCNPHGEAAFSLAEYKMITEKTLKAIQAETKYTVVPPTHIVLLYLIYKGMFLIFARNDGMIGTISGTREMNERIIESYSQTCIRELVEESRIIVEKRNIISAQHYFYTISHRGKLLYGQSFYTILDCNSFELSEIRLNHELIGFELIKAAEAVKLIKSFGYPEQLAGLKCVANIIKEQNL